MAQCTSACSKTTVKAGSVWPSDISEPRAACRAKRISKCKTHVVIHSSQDRRNIKLGWLAPNQQTFSAKRVQHCRQGSTLQAASSAVDSSNAYEKHDTDPPANPDMPRLAVTISNRAETIVRKGHPWIYDKSVQSVKGEVLGAGQLAIVFDKKNKFLAVGLYDPQSPLRVRVVHTGKSTPVNADFWRNKVRVAAEKRVRLAQDPATTGYRWINGESDGLPGLVVDRYHDTLVAKIYTAAWFPHLEAIVWAVRAELGGARMVLRLSRNSQAAALAEFGLQDGQMLFGSPVEGAVLFKENGLTFEAEVLNGQKTGFFLDQRDNRQQVEQLAKGAKVLNAFSFSGGFSLYAARGGATEVTSLDISSHALESAVRNFQHNSEVAGVRNSKHITVQADCFQWLANAAGSNYDVVILDPPCLAKRQDEKEQALKAYRKLSTLGLACLNKGGTLVSASCSARIQADEFFNEVLAAVHNSGRKYEELDRTLQPVDHPCNFMEAKYLKCIYIRCY